MDYGTRDIGMAGLAFATEEASLSLFLRAHQRDVDIKPAPRKKGPIKKPPDKPLPMPDGQT